jgi:hypothetical protein
MHISGIIVNNTIEFGFLCPLGFGLRRSIGAGSGF